MHKPHLRKMRKPFGYLRNFEWWIFYGSIGHNLIWLRVGELPWGMEIKAWSSIKILRVKR